jgi:3-methyladenine DNA glycosylase AlkD
LTKAPTICIEEARIGYTQGNIFEVFAPTKFRVVWHTLSGLSDRLTVNVRRAGALRCLMAAQHTLEEEAMRTEPNAPQRDEQPDVAVRPRLTAQVADIVADLRLLGSESIRKTFIKHGAREPLFGVKIGDLKPIQRRIKTDYRLALDLYNTGISDAMYLAGLIADDPKMTRDDLQHWVDAAYWSLLSESTVPWVAAGSPHGWHMALKWIDADVETVACAGWATISSLVGITNDTALDLPALESLLLRVASQIHGERNRVRYTMNNFILAVGGCVTPLTDAALRTADAVGRITVDMGDTSCNVLLARERIEKMRARGIIGKKRKTAKC